MFLARQIKKESWASALENGGWPKGDFPPEILYDLEGFRGGVSVWRTDNESDEEFIRIFSALCLIKNKIDDVAFVVVRQQKIVDLGIVLKPDLGKTPDIETNKKHFNLFNISALRLSKFADILADAVRENMRFLPKKRIQEFALERIRSKEFDRGVFWNEQKKKDFELLRRFFIEGAV